MYPTLRHSRIENLFDSLEPRCLLAADALPFTLYYPEGYAHNQISEFVPITNPNDHPIQFQLLARYETGDRDQVIAQGIIPANTRAGVTVNVANDPSQRLVRGDAAFALVLKASDEVSATISHYDYGATIGQSFTDQPSTSWTFTNVQKDHQNVRDYLVFYNTSNQTANITISFLADSGETINLTQAIGAQRRGGLNVDATDAVPAGTYGVVITSDQPIVAALTHYDVSLHQGFGVLGAENGGGQAGIIPTLDFQDNDRGHGNDPDHHDDDNPGQGGQHGNAGGGNDQGEDGNGGNGGNGNGHGHGNGHRTAEQAQTNTLLNVLNTTDHAATVTFTFVPHEGTPALDNPVRTVTIPAHSREAFGFLDLSFALDDSVGVQFTSDQVITVAALIVGPHRSAAIPAITSAATEWGFGEGFLTRERAGQSINEHLFIFNPASTQADISINFLFVDGTSVTLHETVDAGQIADIDLSTLQPLLNHIDRRYFFGMQVTGDAPFVATLDHLDRIMAGGFTTAGIPGGTIVPLSSILLPPPTPAHPLFPSEPAASPSISADQTSASTVGA